MLLSLKGKLGLSLNAGIPAATGNMDPQPIFAGQCYFSDMTSVYVPVWPFMCLR